MESSAFNSNGIIVITSTYVFTWTRLLSKRLIQDDPQDAVVANMYKNNREEFNKKAKEWTRTFASPKFQEEKIKVLVEMGFDPKVSKVWSINYN